MNPGPYSTPTPHNYLRLMQWNTNGMSGMITELLTFLNSNNVNITAIRKTKMTNMIKPLKTQGLAAVRLDRHKNKGGGLLLLIKDTIPFINNTAANLQSADAHLVQQGISITMPNRQQLHIHNIYIPPRGSCSADHLRTSTATMKCRLLLGTLMRIIPDCMRSRKMTKKANS